MQLEQATAVLRPRSAWEAVDLGCSLARRQWGKLMTGWLSVALPLWAVIAVLLRDHPGWAGFAMWWTKPILTRQPVFFMSRALFGPAPRVRDFWKDAKASLFRGLLSSLTIRRFSFRRSFVLPVIMLENQQGKAYEQRTGILSTHGGGSASSLAFVAVKLEMVIAAGLLYWVNAYLPEGVEEWAKAGDSMTMTIPAWFYWLGNAFYALAIAIIEPMYASAGFALYINSRTHLEGWDIEVIFRRISLRLQPLAGAALAVLLGLFFLAGPSPAAAGESRSKSVIEEVLKEPDFELDKRQVRKSKPLEEDKEDKTPPPRENEQSGGFDLRGYGMVIIAAVIALAAWLIWKNRAALRHGRGAPRPVPAGPRVVMGMDIAPESLPDDIPQTAWREYQAGRPAEALRLLYRGSLAWLVSRASLPVHESDTEGDCLRHTQALTDTARVSFFESLTAAWVSCAYASQPPAAGSMKQLCDQWPFSLRERAPRSGTSATAAAWWLLPFLAWMLQGCSKQTGKPAEMEERIVGYKGSARVNPWLAAEKFLNRMGVSASVQPSAVDERPDGTMLFMPSESITSRGAARQMVRWAGRGGHLVLACSATDRFFNDYSGNSQPAPARHEPVYEELGIEPSATLLGNITRVDFGDGEELALEADKMPSLKITAQRPDILAGSRDSATLASFNYGMGRITLLASATPFRNRYISDGDNAEILYQLSQLENSRRVVFIFSSRANLWDMLRTYAWMPLTATLLLIALWLWRHLPRFGPAIPADHSSVRHFGTQLDEAGTFLSERALPSTLPAAARRFVLQAAALRGLHPENADFIEQLAARSGLPADAINRALHDDSATADTISIAATLQKLQQSLGANI